MGGKGVDRKRLAIIGGGSSGLISLKYAVENLPDWEIVCFEKLSSLIGCWGDPYPGFVSTSTKYTTQFSCFRKFDSAVSPDGRATKQEFFRNDEFGRYLEEFATAFDLKRFVRLNTRVELVSEDGDRWRLRLGGGDEYFDAVIICTGLADCLRPFESPIPTRSPLFEAEAVQGQTVVIVGGGESAADNAVRLAEPRLNNQVFLSLGSGIRVSPRYHPIAGLPSDYLRNRLLLSIHEDLRNFIGEGFVRARIKYRNLFESIFPAARRVSKLDCEQEGRKRYWDLLLTSRAKDKLFNMFHNKADGFLDLVAEGRIKIVGLPVDSNHQVYQAFDSEERIKVNPDCIISATGYRSALESLTGGKTSIEDFYLGSVHVDTNSLFLVGFARPIIGNIPTISEMQARYVTGLIAGKFPRPANIKNENLRDRQYLKRNFSEINTAAIYPVEMFPYTDKLARMMGSFPSLARVGSFYTWIKIQLSPLTTLQYLDNSFDRAEIDRQPVFLPKSLVALLLIIKAVDLPYRAIRRLWPIQ